MRYLYGFFWGLIAAISILAVFVPSVAAQFGNTNNNSMIFVPVEQTGTTGVVQGDLLLHLIWGGVAACCLAAAAAAFLKLKRLKDEAARRASEKKIRKKPYRMMVENTQEGILIIQLLEICYANQKVYDLLKLNPNHSGSVELADYIFPEDLNLVLEHYEKIMLAGEQETRFAARARKEDQSVLWLNVRFVQVVWEGEPAVLGFVQDITKQKMMEQDLQQAQRMEAIGALSGGIAHDFNNILTTIIGNAEVALMDIEDDDERKKEFTQIRKSGYRARDLVRQILSICRESPTHIQPLYLTPMIKEAIKLLQSTLPKHIRIRTDFDTRLGLVNADSMQLYQVFMNLCTNARDAVEETQEPCLEIGLNNKHLSESEARQMGGMKPGRYVVISVKDNGKGIDPKAADKIFNPYFSTKDKATATGLGLATASGIVKQYNGFIGFESEPGQGARFSVFLPVFEEEKSTREQQKSDIPVMHSGRILFVDDEQEITTIAKRMLNSQGFSVMAVNSGKAAFEAFMRSPDFFDLMITDLSMPGMTGDVLVKKVLNVQPKFPVIMCTGYSDRFNEEAAKKMGVCEYIRKPYDFKALSDLASLFIRRSAAA